MVNVKNPLEVEFRNRASEIFSIRTRDIKTKRGAKTFLTKIVNFVEFIETHPTYKKKIHDLYNYHELQILKDDLRSKGNDILDQLRLLLESTTESLKKSNIVLPNEKALAKKHIGRG